MITKSRGAIVIPLYKSFSDLSNSELLSLESSLTNLNKYVHVLVGPHGFQWMDYLSFCYSFNVKVTTVEFDGYFFNSIEGYNRLLVSEIFFNNFKRFEYILVFQLDAYVFRDELKKWCEEDFDYIGAPWNGYDSFENKPLIGVGNGGFSLRSITGSIRLLEKLRMLEVLEQFKDFNWKGIVPRLPSIVDKLYQSKKKPCQFEINFNFQEDVFWCKAAPVRLKSFSCNSFLLKFIADILIKDNFRIAPVEEALKFSFETNPRGLFEMNKEQLPFGCHAWEKYEPEFWSSFIKAK